MGYEGIEENTRGYNVLQRTTFIAKLYNSFSGGNDDNGRLSIRNSSAGKFLSPPVRYVFCPLHCKHVLDDLESETYSLCCWFLQSLRSCFAVFVQLTVVKTNKIPRTKREERRARAQQRVREDTFLNSCS